MEDLPTETKTIICIPGLGGHESSLSGYKELLPEYKLIFLRVVNHFEAQENLKKICEKEESVILLANCYGVQLASRLIEEMPEKVRTLVVLEAFFAEFHMWRFLAITVNEAILLFLRLADVLGIKRSKFPTHIDYAPLAKYPIWVQPVFDLYWQNWTDYVLKLRDIAFFKLPKIVKTRTLFIVSPKGYIRSKKDRSTLLSVFVNSEIIDVKANSHNIVAVSAPEIASIIKMWLNKHT